MIEETLERINKSLADMAAAVGQLKPETEPVLIQILQQSLVDLVGAMERITPVDLAPIAEAIKGLSLSVNVAPTQVTVEPAQVNVAAPQVHVDPTPVHVSVGTPFKPLVMTVKRGRTSGLIDSIEIAERT
jgi:hypothetical protein